MNPIYRLHGCLEKTGVGKTKHHSDIRNGLMVKPIKLGPRASGYPADEIEQIVNARIGGATDAQLRTVVSRLMAQRSEKLASALGAPSKGCGALSAARQ